MLEGVWGSRPGLGVLLVFVRYGGFKRPPRVGTTSKPSHRFRPIAAVSRDGLRVIIPGSHRALNKP